MARQVENRKMPVSKIDDVAFLEMPRRMSGGDAVVVGRVAFMRQGIDEKAIALVQPVAREAGTDFRRKALRCQRRKLAIIGHARRLDFMHETCLEFMQGAD